MPRQGADDLTVGTHQKIDERLLHLVEACVQKVDADPKLLEIAHNNLTKVTNRRVRAEWEALLSRPWIEVRAILLEDSDRGRAMRQNAPFGGILSDVERLAYFKPWQPSA